jgi:hypothetical protein
LELCDLQAAASQAAQAVCALSSAFSENAAENPENAGNQAADANGQQWRGSGGGRAAAAARGRGQRYGGEVGKELGKEREAKDMELLSQSLVNTMHLKQYWPSALRRIAALELQLELQLQDIPVIPAALESPTPFPDAPAEIPAGSEHWRDQVVALCTLVSAAARKDGADAVRRVLQEALVVVADVVRATPVLHDLSASKVKFEALSEGRGGGGGGGGVGGGGGGGGGGGEGGGGRGSGKERRDVRGRKGGGGGIGDGECEAPLVKASNALVTSPSPRKKGRGGIGSAEGKASNELITSPNSLVRGGKEEEDPSDVQKETDNKGAQIEGAGDGEEEKQDDENNNNDALALWLAAVRAGCLKLGDKVCEMYEGERVVCVCVCVCVCVPVCVYM